MKYLLHIALLFAFFPLFAQVGIEGNVKDQDNQEVLVGVNILVQGTSLGTSSDENGDFHLQLNQKLPITLIFSAIGYQNQKKILQIADKNKNGMISLIIEMEEEISFGKEVVISASRVEETILESAVSIEKMDIFTIKNTSSANFYDAIENLKGVQGNSNSLLFKSLNTRGFASFSNVRFVQAIDGVDNAAPGLNFAAGNLIGIPEIDVESVELLPGASSALYGANAFNGILFINSKNPFDYQGLTVMLRSGATQQKAAGTNPFSNISLRYAKAFNDKFAFKVNITHFDGEDWHASNYADIDLDPTNEAIRGENNPSYDGVNIYGDEIAATVDLDQIVKDAIAAGAPFDNFEEGFFGKMRVARTGYKEEDLLEGKAKNFKINAGLYYKLTQDTQISYQYNKGWGQSIMQGANRIALKNFSMAQHKAQIKGKHFFVRGFASFENAGDAYDTRFASWNINRTWKSDRQWFEDYIQSYLLNFLGGINLGGQKEDVIPFAHLAARKSADQGRFLPNSLEFKEALDRISHSSNFEVGSKFIDKSQMYNLEGNYSFKDQISFMDLQIGGSFRRSVLNSEGTVFNDASGPIGFNQHAFYVQAVKKLVNQKLKMTSSLRYDKNQNFQARLSPRLSLVYHLDKEKNHNLRTSFQTGFRNPESQAQYLGLNLGVALSLGGTEDNVNNFAVNLPFFNQNGELTTITLTGQQIYQNSYTNSSVQIYLKTNNSSDLEVAKVPFIRPEQVQVYEVGYRGLIKKFLYIDASVYHNIYTNFLATTRFITPVVGNVNEASGREAIDAGKTVLSILYTNTEEKVSSLGADVGLTMLFYGGYVFGLNYSYSELDTRNANKDLIPAFNTPQNRYKIAFGNRNVAKNVGFQLDYRWSGSYLWEDTFASGKVNAFHVLDAQLTYKMPKLKSTIKLGATNILQKEYQTAFGAANIGTQYLISILFEGK